MTTLRAFGLTLSAIVACTALSAAAQGLHLPSTPGVPPANTSGSASASASQQSADYIVAIVNTEPITNQQVRLEAQRMARQLVQQQRPIPEGDALASAALDRLLTERAQLHFARELGIKIDKVAVDDAEKSVARQNKVDLDELHRRLASDGMDVSSFRAQLRDQLLLNRVREREVNQKVKVTELDIDQYLREQKKNPDDAHTELNIANILVALPENPTDAQIATAQAKAQRVLDRARGGEDFAKLARENSDAPGAASDGGEIGLRTADRYPTLFVDVTRALQVGGLALVRSGAGIHVLKVIEKHPAGMPATTAVQTHASHILLRVTPDFSEAAAVAKLSDFRKRILAGQADFATLAKENSQDASAAQGGDLGWANPGQFVPEFENALNDLAPGEISQPLVSRFGVHLIKLQERRTVKLSEREKREAIRSILLEKKLNDAYVTWVQDLRRRAYVEMRQAPS
ncbi:MAG: peptidylprolyl isomerase [Burkholderiaceae bacterium]